MAKERLTKLPTFGRHPAGMLSPVETAMSDKAASLADAAPSAADWSGDGVIPAQHCSHGSHGSHGSW